MLLQRFKHFVSYLRQDQDVMALVQSVEVFRYFNEQWYDENDKVLEDKRLCTQLSHTRLRILDPYWRPQKSRVAFIAVHTYMAVVRATYTAPPKQVSLKRTYEKIEEARKHGENAFEAVHDSLTGLLNQKGLNEAAREIVLHSKPQPTGGAASPGSSDSASMLAMLAMDIDRFKQVNDNFGHPYGDVVIQAVAKRLADHASSLETESKGTAQFRAARLGGEEFVILASGTFDLERLKSVADSFREIIANTSLPSVEEWELLASQEMRESPFPPPLQRMVTISVGITSMLLSKPAQFERAKDTLRADADLALYVAKAGGRNTVRVFSEIVQRHGRVLQHHPDTDVVAIDLGRQFNVLIGQEFYVFHPEFNGNTEFVRNDGRTNKVLGKYPKTAIGRIEVFDVQPEIAFCRVRKQECRGLFPEGSHLEAIPIGSISHLLPTPSFGGVASGLDLTPVEQLSKLIIEPSSPSPVVVVFSVDNVDARIKERGTAFINETLAQLFAAMRELLPPASRISQLQSTEFAALVTLDPFGNVGAADISQKIITLASERCKKLATFSAGAFGDSPQHSPSEGDRSELRREHILQYARYAASYASRKGNAVEVFSPKTAVSIMYASRSKQLHQQVIEDYRAFRAVGVINAEVENLAAISGYSLGATQKELTFEAGNRAIELHPTYALYYGNMAIYNFRYVGHREAYLMFKKAFEVNPEYKMGDDFRRVYAISTYAEFVATGAPDADFVLALLKSVVDQTNSFFGVTKELIVAAIKEVEDRKITGNQNPPPSSVGTPASSTA